MKGVTSILCFFAVATAMVISVFGIPFLFIWLAFIFIQNDERKAKVIEKLKTLLVEGEQAIIQGVQQRAFAFFSRRMLIALTNNRIIVVQRGILGGFQMQDIQWKDLVNAKIDENVLSHICGSNLAFRHLKSGSIIQVDGIEDQIAREMYSKAQFEEQAWAEKRRVRELEEQRAMAGGVFVNTGELQQRPTSSSDSEDVFAKIAKAKHLLDGGVISDAEFQEMKAKILSGSRF